MEFNEDKFECIRFRANQNLVEESEEGKDIEGKDHLKDLGIQLSNDLTFSKHIDKTVSTCNKTIRLISRTFRTRSTRNYGGRSRQDATPLELELDIASVHEST